MSQKSLRPCAGSGGAACWSTDTPPNAGIGVRHRLLWLRNKCSKDLRPRQLEVLTKVWEATAKAMHWRENALGAMMRALAGGCTLEHLAAVTGFDVEVVKRLLHGPSQGFRVRHPTDPHAPGEERFYR